MNIVKKKATIANMIFLLKKQIIKVVTSAIILLLISNSILLPQNMLEKSESKNINIQNKLKNTESDLYPVANSLDMERAPFLFSTRDYLYAIYEAIEDAKSEIRISISSNRGEEWVYKRYLYSETNDLFLPQAFVYEDEVYIVFQSSGSTSNSIHLYKNPSSDLSASGEFTVVSESSYDCIRPTITVTETGYVSCAYFNITESKFVIKEGYSGGTFQNVFEDDFQYPNEFLRIDASNELGRQRIVINRKVDGVNQIVVYSRSEYGWQTDIRRWNETVDIHSPSVGSFGNNWMFGYLAGSETKIVYSNSGSFGTTVDISNYSSFPTVDISSNPYGDANIVYIKNNKLYRRHASHQNLSVWSDEQILFEQSYEISNDDFISVNAYGKNSGTLFTIKYSADDYDIYFAPFDQYLASLNQPTNLSLSLNDSTSVIVNWNDNSNYESEYQLLRRKGSYNNDWELITTLPANSESYFDQFLDFGTRYTYKVLAKSENGISNFSNELSITTPANSVLNHFDYRLSILVEGFINIVLHEGTFWEGLTYYLPEVYSIWPFQDIADSYNALAYSIFHFDDIANEDLFLDIKFVYNPITGIPFNHFEENLFMEMWIDVYKLPGFNPVDYTYHFNEGEFITFQVPKDEEFIDLLNQLDLTPDDLSFAYIGDSGWEIEGMESYNYENFVQFNINSFLNSSSFSSTGASYGLLDTKAAKSKFGGGRGTLHRVIGINDTKEIPNKFNLKQNYPNPFNPTTSIKYQLPETSHVTLKIFNMLGEEIRTLVNERVEAGFHAIKFDATDLPSGVYIYRIVAGDFVASKKMILMK